MLLVKQGTDYKSAPAGAFSSETRLFFTLQHELVHVDLNYKGFGDAKYNNAQEIAAWSVTKEQGRYWYYYTNHDYEAEGRAGIDHYEKMGGLKHEFKIKYSTFRKIVPW